MEDLRWKKYAVGKDGFVCLVDYMGTDDSIVEAARTSYGKGTKKATDNVTLLRYLMRHHHTTPFEMVQLKFYIRVPMSVWRQWIRHRTASVNEYSTRYSEAIDSILSVDHWEWRTQSTLNKQGSEGIIGPVKGKILTVLQKAYHGISRGFYKLKLRWGVTREQARDDLPLGTYTEAYWSINLHNLLHFLQLRMDEHAQQEIRMFAWAIASIVWTLFPETYRAFTDYRVDTVTFTRPEITALETGEFTGMTKREIKEFEEKKGKLHETR